MASTWPDWSFTSGAAHKGFVIVSLANDELAEKKVPHCMFVASNDQGWADWGDTEWSAVSLTVVRSPDTALVAIGEWGSALVRTNAAGNLEERVQDGKISTKGRGPLRWVRAIDGLAWSVGMDRQVYRRDGKDRWTCLDASIRPKDEDDDLHGFEAIDGFSGKDVYAGGWGGELFRYDGKKWTQLDSPTNQLITGIVCAGNEKVYACGRHGVLMVGQRNRWKVIDHGATSEDLFGIAWFKRKLYLASQEQLWRLEGGTLEPVEFEGDEPETCNRLTNTEDLLWSVGPKDIFTFDGTTWERVE